MIKKWGGKNARKKFSRNKIRVSKNYCKKSSGKSAKTRFFINPDNRDQKIGGKNARKNFSKNTRIGFPKNVGKKSSQKSAKTRFL